MTPYTLYKNVYLAKIAVKSSPGPADVEVLPLGVPGHKTAFPEACSQVGSVFNASCDLSDHFLFLSHCCKTLSFAHKPCSVQALCCPAHSWRCQFLPLDVDRVDQQNLWPESVISVSLLARGNSAFCNCTSISCVSDLNVSVWAFNIICLNG